MKTINVIIDSFFLWFANKYLDKPENKYYIKFVDVFASVLVLIYISFIIVFGNLLFFICNIFTKKVYYGKDNLK